MTTTTPPLNCAIVVIGRNEGARLGRSLAAAVEAGVPVVYVDSGSTDASPDIARQLGVVVVALDPALPMSAARARNAGADAIRALHPEVTAVQFVDGDCILDPQWLPAASAALAADPDLAAVCGWRDEEYPRRNIYHRMAQLEWHMAPAGRVAEFGGEVLIRLDALKAVGGYNPLIMAGEDSELSSRVTAQAGPIERLDQRCSIHDIAMDGARQWWKRSVRCGYGFALVSRLHKDSDGLFVEQTRDVLVWGALAPLGALALLKWSPVPVALVAARYGVAAARATYGIRVPGASLTDRVAWGSSAAASALPAAIGATKYMVQQWRGRTPSLVEYK